MSGRLPQNPTYDPSAHAGTVPALLPGNLTQASIISLHLYCISLSTQVPFQLVIPRIYTVAALFKHHSNNLCTSEQSQVPAPLAECGQLQHVITTLDLVTIHLQQQFIGVAKLQHYLHKITRLPELTILRRSQPFRQFGCVCLPLLLCLSTDAATRDLTPTLVSKISQAVSLLGLIVAGLSPDLMLPPAKTGDLWWQIDKDVCRCRSGAPILLGLMPFESNGCTNGQRQYAHLLLERAWQSVHHTLDATELSDQQQHTLHTCNPL